jgi:hypothetical protein
MTVWTQLEPIGFGLAPHGDPTNIDSGLKIHIRGFGDPLTNWASETIPSTTWNQIQPSLGWGKARYGSSSKRRAEEFIKGWGHTKTKWITI